MAKQKKDALDLTKDEMERRSLDATAFEALHESGAAETFENVGIAKFAAFLNRLSSFAQFEALRRIQETKGYRHVRNAHSGEPCKNIKEACQALGFAVDRYYLLKKEVESLGRATAHVLEDGGVSKRVRRALLHAPDDLKGEVVRLVSEGNGDKTATAEQVAEVVGAFIERNLAEAESAKAEAAEQRESARKAERHLEVAKHKAEVLEQAGEEHREEIRALKDKLNALPFRGEGDVLDLLNGARAELLANVGNFERAADALAARVSAQSAAGDGLDQVELRELCLRLSETAVNLWGQCLGKYLQVLDPGCQFTQVWAANALFQSAGTEAEIEQYKADLAAAREGDAGEE